FLIFVIGIGMLPGAVILLVLVGLLVQTMLAIGLGLLLATLNVFFRDIGHVTGVILQFAFWFTPIVYPSSIVPEWARELLAFNPMFGVIEFYHQVFLNPGLPDPALLMPPALLRSEEHTSELQSRENL